MVEQNERPEGLPPVEGRSDIAADLEEEQRNAYSSRLPGTPSRPNEAALKSQQQEQNQHQAVGTLPPVEGRSDVAADREEEQRNAYSSRHAGASTQTGEEDKRNV